MWIVLFPQGYAANSNTEVEIYIKTGVPQFNTERTLSNWFSLNKTMADMFCYRFNNKSVLSRMTESDTQFVMAPSKAGRTQTNNAQLYLAEHYFEWLSHEKLLSAGDC